MKDFDELRQLLDDAAQAIWRYIDVVGSLESKHSTAETTEPLEFSDALIAFSDQRTAMYRLNQRLVIRLGRRHPVVSAYGRALKVLDEAGNNVATMIALEQTAEKELMATRVKARPTWYAAYEGYLDAAQELVGSPVEPISQS